MIPSLNSHPGASDIANHDVDTSSRRPEIDRRHRTKLWRPFFMIGVELVKDKKTKEHAAEERDRVVEAAFERGVLFLGAGPSTVRISPGLVVTKEEADVAVEVLEECISIVEK